MECSLWRFIAGIAAFATLLTGSGAAPPQGDVYKRQCRQTNVVIIGAGMAGISTAQTLTNNSVTDFLIVERNDRIGGRVRSVPFGAKNEKNKTHYMVELGANWVQGLGANGGSENPIWTMAKLYGLANTYSNYSSLQTYDQEGPADFGDLADRYDAAYSWASRHAGRLLTENLQDTSVRAGLALSGWRPRRAGDAHAQALEWWNWDFETAYSPDESGLVFGIAGYNLTFNQWGEANSFVWDQRGFSYIIESEAGQFLARRDPRLLLNTTVVDIAYTPQGIQVSLDGGGCIEARFAVCTVSVGVLQSGDLSFSPPLPRWKREAIEQFQMGTYTKIFMQFEEAFWDPDTEFFLYADPVTRGYYPIFQSLTAPGFLEGSNIMFVTVVGDQSFRVERQSDEVTRAEIMEVLRAMFPHKKIPDPIAFMYPRWSTEEWTYGSYSNWPVGMTLEKHQNLRANIERLYFAGEGTSAPYFGFLHGAWFEGHDVGLRIAGLLGGEGDVGECGTSTTIGCGSMDNYVWLHGTTFLDEYDVKNGWPVSSFINNLET